MRVVRVAAEPVGKNEMLDERSFHRRSRLTAFAAIAATGAY